MWDYSGLFWDLAKCSSWINKLMEGNGRRECSGNAGLDPFFGFCIMLLELMTAKKKIYSCGKISHYWLHYGISLWWIQWLFTNSCKLQFRNLYSNFRRCISVLDSFFSKFMFPSLWWTASPVILLFCFSLIKLLCFVWKIREVKGLLQHSTCFLSSPVNMVIAGSFWINGDAFLVQSNVPIDNSIALGFSPPSFSPQLPWTQR